MKLMRQSKPYTPSKLKIDKKYSMLVYVVTLVLAVVFRSIQLDTNMNFQTGKYIKDGPSNWLVPLIIAVGMILIVILMFFGQSRDKAIKSCILLNPMRLKYDRLNKKISAKAAASMFIMAVLLAYEVIIAFIDVGRVNLELSTEDDPVFIFAGIPLFSWLMYLLMGVLVVTFISTGINILKCEGISKGNCFFLSIYPIWKLLSIFNMIITYQLIGPYSEKCYILFADMASSVFILYAIRFFCGFEKKNTRIWLCIYGYAASIFAAVSIVPRYVMFFTIDYSIREGMLSPNASDIGVIFFTITVVAVFWSTYVYRVMPKLNITGKRRWSGVQLDATGNTTMKSIDDN